MHSIKDIRSNIDLFKKKISERNTKINFDELLALDKEYREIIQQKEKLEHDKKQLSKSKDEKNFSKSKEISNKILELEKQLQNIKKKLDNILNIIPNIAHSDVPIGKDETANKLIRKNGEISKFNFKVKSHIEIGELTKSIDFNTAAKLSGSRYVMLKNNYAKLERALINFMLDIHTRVALLANIEELFRWQHRELPVTNCQCFNTQNQQKKTEVGRGAAAPPTRACRPPRAAEARAAAPFPN